MCSDLAFFLRGLSPYGLPVWLFQASVYRRTQRVFVEKVSPTPRSPPVLWLFRFVLHSDPRFSPLESLGPCPLLSRRAGWRGPFFLFVFGASSLLVCFFWLVVQTPLNRVLPTLSRYTDFWSRLWLLSWYGCGASLHSNQPSAVHQDQQEPVDGEESSGSRVIAASD